MTQIKLIDNWYLGKRSQGENSVPLGFLTPSGTDSAATKRKATVDTWVGKHSHSLSSTDNFKASEPISGFRIAECIKRHSRWSGGSTKWRIEDPRGFELEIDSANMIQILSCSTTINGEIHGKMCWGREGSQNVLIPIASELYQKSLQDTLTANATKISIKTVKPGSFVRFKNGEEHQYAGFLYHYQLINTHSNSYSYSVDSKSTLKISAKRVHVFLHKINNYVAITSYVDPKVVAIISEGEELMEPRFKTPRLEPKINFIDCYRDPAKFYDSELFDVSTLKYRVGKSKGYDRDQQQYSSTKLPVQEEDMLVMCSSGYYHRAHSGEYYNIEATAQFPSGWTVEFAC